MGPLHKLHKLTFFILIWLTTASLVGPCSLGSLGVWGEVNFPKEKDRLNADPARDMTNFPSDMLLNAVQFST